MKRILSMLLAIVMVVGMMSGVGLTALAEDTAAEVKYGASADALTEVTLAEHIYGYPDAERVSGYAIPALNWAIGAGIINGLDGALAPQDGATRAQLATMLMRFDTMR